MALALVACGSGEDPKPAGRADARRAFGRRPAPVARAFLRAQGLL